VTDEIVVRHQCDDALYYNYLFDAHHI